MANKNHTQNNFVFDHVFVDHIRSINLYSLKLFSAHFHTHRTWCGNFDWISTFFFCKWTAITNGRNWNENLLFFIIVCMKKWCVYINKYCLVDRLSLSSISFSLSFDFSTQYGRDHELISSFLFKKVMCQTNLKSLFLTQIEHIYLVRTWLKWNK